MLFLSLHGIVFSARASVVIVLRISCRKSNERWDFVHHFVSQNASSGRFLICFIWGRSLERCDLVTCRWSTGPPSFAFESLCFSSEPYKVAGFHSYCVISGNWCVTSGRWLFLFSCSSCNLRIFGCICLRFHWRWDYVWKISRIFGSSNGRSSQLVLSLLCSFRRTPGLYITRFLLCACDVWNCSWSCGRIDFEAICVSSRYIPLGASLMHKRGVCTGSNWVG